MGNITNFKILSFMSVILDDEININENLKIVFDIIDKILELIYNICKFYFLILI